MRAEERDVRDVQEDDHEARARVRGGLQHVSLRSRIAQLRAGPGWDAHVLEALDGLEHAVFANLEVPGVSLSTGRPSRVGYTSTRTNVASVRIGCWSGTGSGFCASRPDAVAAVENTSAAASARPAGRRLIATS